jgi:FkbM family methyltransferase
MIVIQLGTNTGEDHVLELCKSLNPDLIILVEPFQTHNDSIKNNYKDLRNWHIENLVISEKEDELVEFYFTELDGKIRGPECSYMVSSIRPEHLVKHGYLLESLSSFQVKSISINSLFKKYNLSQIDYLFIDIEGIDFEVLKMLDFEKYNIKNIQIEYLHLNKAQLIEFMNTKGYKEGVSFEPRNDILFTKV